MKEMPMFGKKIFATLCVCTYLILGSSTAWGYLTVDEGWDGPGLGSADLTYYFGPLTSDLPADAVRSTLVSAMDVWAAVADITFTETATSGLANSIDFAFVTGAHGDGQPFGTPPNAYLGHAFYPATYPTWEPLAGDVHFNDAYLWELGNDLGSSAFDLMYVAVHELGHSLGLDHSEVPSAVMWDTTYYWWVFDELSTDDISGIQSLYAAPALVPEPSSMPLLASAIGLLLVACRHKRFGSRLP